MIIRMADGSRYDVGQERFWLERRGKSAVLVSAMREVGPIANYPYLEDIPPERDFFAALRPGWYENEACRLLAEGPWLRAGRNIDAAKIMVGAPVKSRKRSAAK